MQTEGILVQSLDFANVHGAEHLWIGDVPTTLSPAPWPPCYPEPPAGVQGSQRGYRGWVRSSPLRRTPPAERSPPMGARLGFHGWGS
jgi:hypothetical protein